MSTSGYGQSTLIAEKDKRIFELEKQNRKLQQALNNQSHRHGKAVNDLVAQLAECRTGLKETLALRALLGKGLLPSDLYPRSEFIARKIIDAAQ